MRFACCTSIPLLLIGLSACGAGSDSSIDLFVEPQAAAPTSDASASDSSHDSAVADGSGGCSALGCEGDTPYCEPGTATCVACLGNAQCPSDHPICSAGHTCVECVTDAHCQGGDLPWCLTSEGRCVGCLTSSQCGGGTCDTDYECSN